MASALGVPVAVMSSAAEGGAWGIAILAQYMRKKSTGETLGAYLEHHVFRDAQVSVIQPEPNDSQGFSAYLEKYIAGIPAARAASDIE